MGWITWMPEIIRREASFGCLARTLVRPAVGPVRCVSVEPALLIADAGGRLARAVLIASLYEACERINVGAAS